MANLRTNNLSGEQGQNAIRGSVTFGGYVDGLASDYLSVADHDDFNMGTGEFTFECWLFAVPHGGASYNPNYMGIASSQNYTTDGFLIQVANDGQLRLVGPLSGGGYFDQSAGPSLFNEWNHVAVVRTSGTIKGFVNGIEVISASQGTTIDFSLGGSLNIGENGYSQYPGDYPFRGTISNLRLTKGLARYTSTFTPPTFELTADADTVLLCCQDSDNPFQEETGKTITGFGRYYPDTGELFTDTGFNTTGAWTGAGSNGWTVSGNGVATHAQGTAGDLYQQITNLVVGQTYQLQVDVLTSDDDVAYFYIDNNPGGSYPALGNASNAYVGHYEHYFVANATSMYVGFRGSSLFAGTITNLRLQSYGVGLNPKLPEIIPPYGVDAGNTFGGPIQQSSQGYMYFPTGRTEERGRGRAVIFAGSVTPVSPNFSSNIDYVEMRSSGVGVRFGNCTGNSFHGSCGSSTRGFMFGGQIGSPDVQTNLIEFVTIASEGDSIDFGDLLRAKRRLTGQGHSNSTRAILAGGGGDAPLAPDNVIQFFTMASTGDATDFGDLNAAKDNSAGTGSPTRMLIAGGRDYTPSATVVNKIEYITMSTTGNVTDFGDLTVARAEVARASNAVRSVFVSGGTPSPKVNTIDFVTTATTGDATDFGDLPIAKGGMASANNSIIGIFVAGTTGSRTTDIQSLTIATTGDGVAFGDCNVTDPSQGREACSDSHGGLS